MTEPLLVASVADDLMPTLGSVRRLLRRVGGTAFDGDQLSAAQREVVLLVGMRPGSAVSHIAEELGLAPNTVSTLVSRLTAVGWLIREPDPTDRRVCRLRLAAAVQAQADAVRARRRQALRSALDELEPGQLTDLRVGLVALNALGERLRDAERTNCEATS